MHLVIHLYLLIPETLSHKMEQAFGDLEEESGLWLQLSKTMQGQVREMQSQAGCEHSRLFSRRRVRLLLLCGVTLSDSGLESLFGNVTKLHAWLH